MISKANDFWKNVARLGSGTVLAQVIAFVCGPIITRIFDAETYGALGIYNSVSGSLIIIAALRYDRAILLARKSETQQLINLCMVTILCVTLLVLLLLGFSYPYLNDFFKLEKTPWLLFLVPVSILLNSSMNVFYALGNSYKAYAVLSASVVIHSLLSNVLKIILGYYLRPTTQMLVISELTGILCSTMFLMFFLKEKIGFFFQRMNVRRMRVIAYTFIKFPRYDTFTSLINTVSWLMPNFLLAYYFSKEYVGFYTLGFTMLRLPMNLIGKAVGDVFYKNAIDNAASRENLAETSMKTILQLFSLGLIPTVIVFLFGRELFSFFFGANWAMAGSYSEVLAFWSLIWFVSSPISNLYYILNLQDKFFRFMIVNFFMRLSALVVGGLSGNPYLALLLYSLVSSAVYGYQIFYLMTQLGLKFRELLQKLVVHNIYIVWTLAGLLLTKYFVKEGVVQLLIICLLGALSFAFLVKKKIRLAKTA